MFDVIVVGARCAGASTALLLSRAGQRVLLVDRASFPSDTLSTHYLHQPAVHRLDRWGVLPALVATGAPPLDRALWTIEDVELVGCADYRGQRAAFGPRRSVLDTLLVEAAVDAGAEFREKSAVTDLLWEDGRVCGVVGRTGTRAWSERARLVVGADGVNSKVAAVVGASPYDDKPSMNCIFYTYWDGMSAEYEVYLRDRHAIGVVPTNGGLVMVGVEWPRTEFPRVRSDVESAYREALRRVAPDLAERVAGATRAERFAGTAELPNYFRPAGGPGWALAGDAGHRKDPVGAYGISDAFRDADLLASSVAPALAGEGSLDDAVTAFWRRRDADAAATYQFNLAAAELSPPEDLLDVLRAARENQADVDRFFGLIAGIVTAEEFFAALSGAGSATA